MNATTKELAIGFSMAVIMLLGSALAKASGMASADISQRAMLALTGGYLARVGNALPKARVLLQQAQACGSAGLAARRFVGWTWTLAGSAVVASACLLPIPIAKTVTLTSLLSGIAATMLYGNLHLRTPRRSS